MSTEQSIKPEKITKPIQLLGAWLAGLFSVDSCFLFAASNMEGGSFESTALVIAAILNVPLFLLAVFLLQTKFRPELQEDSYYSSYLNQKTNQPITIKKSEAQFLELNHKLTAIENQIASRSLEKSDSETLVNNILVGINANLSNQDEIKNKLSEHGVTSCTSFGATTPPEKLAVAISEYLPNSVAQKFIAIAKELGFTHYGYFDNHMESTEEEVLFGAYGDTSRYELT